MSTLFASLGAITELFNLAIDIAVLLVGIQAVRTGLDLLDRIIRAWLWLAGLVQLLFQLLCTAIAEYGPVIGRHLGRIAGRTVRLGRQARQLYDRHAAHHVTVLVLAADRSGRAFVLKQLGTAYPQLSKAIATKQEGWSPLPSSLQTLQHAAQQVVVAGMLTTQATRQIHGQLIGRLIGRDRQLVA